MADKLGSWVFLHAGAAGWEWRRIDPAGGADLQRSTRVFSSLLECINDAKRYGYLPPGHNEPGNPRITRS
jgi:hypothetical protein